MSADASAVVLHLALQRVRHSVVPRASANGASSAALACMQRNRKWRMSAGLSYTLTCCARNQAGADVEVSDPKPDSHSLQANEMTEKDREQCMNVTSTMTA